MDDRREILNDQMADIQKVFKEAFGDKKPKNYEKICSQIKEISMGAYNEHLLSSEEMDLITAIEDFLK